MDIKVVARHGELSQDLRSYAEDKMTKLERYFEGIHWVTVTLDDQPEGEDKESGSGHGRRPRRDAGGRGRGPTICTRAIDSVMDKAEHQLTKFKEKLKGHRSQ